MVKLRDYQEEAVKKMIWARSLEGGDLLSLPTGAGKSLIISEFARQIKEPILILCPSKELLEQDKEKLSQWTSVNVYSAGMNEKTVGDITIATIQSAYKNPELFTRFNVVIIDEADLVNPKNLAGMYNKLFRGMGNPKVYGLTATPFRMDSYYKRWGRQAWQVETVTTVKVLTRYRERFWLRMLYVVHPKDLIEKEYLVPLTYHATTMIPQNKLKFNKSKSEFDLEDFDRQFEPFTEKTADLINGLEKQSLIFASTIEQAERIASHIPECVIITSKTPKKEREQSVEGFRNGTIKHVINVGILLVGFDKPDLENIVIARPTRSLRLHFQLLGRGMRPNKGKKTCNIYDLVGNIATLGTAESLRIDKYEGKWNILTDTFPKGAHYVELFKFQIKKPTENSVEDYYTGKLDLPLTG